MSMWRWWLWMMKWYSPTPTTGPCDWTSDTNSSSSCMVPRLWMLTRFRLRSTTSSRWRKRKRPMAPHLRVIGLAKRWCQQRKELLDKLPFAIWGRVQMTWQIMSVVWGRRQMTWQITSLAKRWRRAVIHPWAAKVIAPSSTGEAWACTVLHLAIKAFFHLLNISKYTKYVYVEGVHRGIFRGVSESHQWGIGFSWYFGFFTYFKNFILFQTS